MSYHKNELDTCGVCGGYDGCLKGCTCPTCKNMSKKIITKVCLACGITANYLTCLKKYGRPPKKVAFDVPTWHMGKCGVCGRNRQVTEPRDFFYPDFNLIIKKIKV